MTRPQILSAVPPALTPDAFKFGIKGLMVAKCVITTAGTLQGCRIIKGLPFMNEAVLQVLPLWRFTPPLVRGKPTSVEYVIPIHVQ